MNKKILLIILTLLLFLFACRSLDQEDRIYTHKNLNFQIEKVQLTKIFQKTEAYGEFKTRISNPKDGEKLKLIISAGLKEASALEINKIVREDNDLNIYINTISEENSSLVIPQATVLLNPKDIENPDTIKFNIIDEGSKPINLKIGYNDAISIIESHFKLNTIITPDATLIKNTKGLVWEMQYPAVIDKSEASTPLIKLKVGIDANSGKILNKNKEKISEALDSGNIIGFFKDRYILYKKLLEGNKENSEELWVYNIYTNEKSLVFSSAYSISTPHISNGNSYIAFIEIGKSGNNLYIVPKHTKNAYKISLEQNINPTALDWIDDKNLCLIESKDNNSTVYNFNIDKNILEEVASFNKKISNLSIRNGSYLFTEEDESTYNDDIYITRDFKDFNLISKGFNPKFLNNNTIVYMKSKEKKEQNFIHIYDLTSSEDRYKFDGLISGYQIIDDYSLIYSVKSTSFNSYIFKKYNYHNNSIEELTESVTSKAYYNNSNNLFFINLNSPFDSDKNMLIYPIKP